MTLYSGDLRQTICTFGPIAFNNFGEGSAISIEPEGDLFNVKVSADGKTTRHRTHNNNHVATITLMETSTANVRMILLSLRNAALSGITYPFIYKNPLNGEYCQSNTAFVQKYPGMESNNEPTEREWNIYLPDCRLTELDNHDLGYPSIPTTQIIPGG